MKVWVVTGQSESGDPYGPWVFMKKPTQAKLKKLVREQGDDGADDDGPGDFGSWIHLNQPELAEVR